MWSHGYNPPPCYAEKVACSARSSRKPKRNSSCAGSVGPLNIIQGAAALFCTTTHISPLYSQDSRLHTRPPPPRPDMGRGSFSSRRAGVADRSERRPGPNWDLFVSQKGRVGHCVLSRSECFGLSHSFKERSVLSVLFLSFWRLMRPKRT